MTKLLAMAETKTLVLRVLMRVVIRAPVLFNATINFLLGEFFESNVDLCFEAIAIMARQYSFQAFDAFEQTLIRLRANVQDEWRKMHLIRFLALQSWKDEADYLVSIESKEEDMELMLEYLRIDGKADNGKYIQLVGCLLLANEENYR